MSLPPVNKNLQNFWSLERQVEHEVEFVDRRLHEPRILPPKECAELEQHLDKASKDLQELQRISGSVDDFAKKKMEEVQEKFISLCGKVHNQYFDYEVCVIVQEATELENALEQEEDMDKISKQVDALREHIVNFHQFFRPDGVNYKLLSSAEGFSNRVFSILSTTAAKKKMDALTRRALTEVTFRRDFEGQVDTEDATLMMELCDMARIFFDKSNDRKSRFNQLSEDIKRRLKTHLSKTGNDFSVSEDDRMVRALLTVAREIAQSTDVDVDVNQWFEELNTLGRESRERAPIIFLRA